MATRYAGPYKITITYSDSRSAYVATISEGGKNRSRQIVRPPASMRGSVDSPSAYDSAASAAMSFADDEGDLHGGSGYVISRTKHSPERRAEESRTRSRHR